MDIRKKIKDKKEQVSTMQNRQSPQNTQPIQPNEPAQNKETTQSNKPDQKFTKSQLATISVVIITAFITTFTGSALNLSIPAIGTEFHASASFIGWIITGYILAAAALSVPFGRFADLTGRKRILVIGIFIFALCSGAGAFAWSIEVLLCFRVLQGIGSAMIFSTNTAVLIGAFSPEKRGKVLGYSIASTYIGLSAGPVVGGFFNHYFGWRSIFILTFIVSIIVFIIAAKKLPHINVTKDGQSMDILGSVLFVAMITSIMYGLSAYSTINFAKYLIPVGVFLSICFILHELKSKSPIVEVRLFANNIGYLFSNIAALLNYGATFALGYLLSIYLQMVLDFDSQISGLILISQPLIMALLSPYTGRLSDKVSPFKLASFGMALCALGLLSFSFISVSYPLWLIIGNLIVVGIGFAFFSSPNTNAVMACVDKKDYGVASSILATMRSVGHSSSMAIVTFIVASNMGNTVLVEAESSELISTMRTSFIVFTCVCAIGIFISLKRKEKN